MTLKNFPNLFFVFMFCLDVAFGIYDYRQGNSIVAPIVIGVFIILFWLFTRSGQNKTPGSWS